MRRFACLLMALVLSAAAGAQADSIKLYTLDCGTIDVADMASFDREGRFAGEAMTLKVPCYLIRHPKGDLLWDAGLDEAIASDPDGIGTAFRSTMQRSLTDQLADLGLTPADIDYLSLSHAHPDHSGNANLFKSSRWIVSRTEHTFMFSPEAAAYAAGYQALETVEPTLFDDSHDVFGDGSALLYRTPGHTPGHTVLLLTLKNAGALMFSGDLYTHAAGRTLGAIPAFNMDADATLRSMQRFEELAAQHGARVVIQHDAGHFAGMPSFPSYLD